MGVMETISSSCTVFLMQLFGSHRAGRQGRSWLLLILLLMQCSCQQSGPQLGEVTGTVTLDGQPFPGAIVTFISTAESGTTSTGVTDQEGRYRLKFTFKKSGAMVGHNQVKIEYEAPSAEDETPRSATKQRSLPAHYQKKGTLSAEVKAGHQVIDFALSSTPQDQESGM